MGLYKSRGGVLEIAPVIVRNVKMLAEGIELGR
jgi:hypothetical protein